MACKTVLAVLALIVVPTLTLAHGCPKDRAVQSSSRCAPGQSWDTATASCVTPISS